MSDLTTAPFGSMSDITAVPYRSPCLFNLLSLLFRACTTILFPFPPGFFSSVSGKLQVAAGKLANKTVRRTLKQLGLPDPILDFTVFPSFFP